MKKNIKFIILCLLVLIISLFIFNKTFFHNTYKSINIPLFTYYNKEKLYTIRSSNYLNNYINNYLSSLEECNGYYYDKFNNKSIIKYTYSNSFIKRITIEYELGNVCSYMSDLKSDWYKELKNNDLYEVDYISCKKDDCKSRKKSIDIDKLIDTIKSSKLEKNDNKDLSYNGNNKYISIYYTDNSTYSNSIKLYKIDDSTLGILLIEDNSSIKSGSYSILEDPNKLIESLIK